MISYTIDNVNQLFPLIVSDIQKHGTRRNSRAGKVLEFNEPVAITYRHPTQRVLFDLNRLCNPVFHFMEGLWMISGARDVEFLDYFNKLMAQYSDDGHVFYGAYGYRWRTLFGFDQIEKAVHLLRANHDDRRVVMAMWDPSHDMGHNQKDHPCNTHVYFKIRDHKLQMTVCNRSNDVLYGLTGANAVHMTMIHEYMAGRVGVEVGMYHSISDSCHVYTEVPVWEAVKDTTYDVEDYYSTEHSDLLTKPYPMFKDCHEKSWAADLELFMLDPVDLVEYKTPFFRDVAQPIALVWEAHKRNRNGLKYVDSIKATDWKFACRRWLEIKEAVK
jgi:thymidylate synthase